MSGAAMCGRRDQRLELTRIQLGRSSDDGREDVFWRDNSYTHIVGCKRRWTNCSGQTERYGCALLYGGTARLTADDSPPFARLPIGAPG